MQFNPVSCKQSIGYAYRRQKYPGWSFLFPRSRIMALAKQVNFHLTVWMLKWHFSSKCVCFYGQLKTAPCSDAHLGDWEILVFLLSECDLQHPGWGLYGICWLTSYFFFMIFTCVKQSWKQRNMQEFSGEGVPRDTCCVVLDGSGLLPTLHLCKTFLVWFVH